MSKSAVLVIMSGMPGSGKTHYSLALAKNLGFSHFNSDVVRLNMFKEPNYTKEEHQKVFKAMDRLMQEYILSGASVIYDANVNTNVYRKRLVDLAKLSHARPILVYIDSNVEESIQRAVSRQSSDDDFLFRDISKEIVIELAKEVELPFEGIGADIITINAGLDPAILVKKVSALI